MTTTETNPGQRFILERYAEYLPVTPQTPMEAECGD